MYCFTIYVLNCFNIGFIYGLLIFLFLYEMFLYVTVFNQSSCIFGIICCIVGIVEHKVIIVGLDNAGKTTILYQL